MAGKRRVIVAGQSHANTLFDGRHRDFEAPTLVKLEPDAIVDATPAAAVYGLVDSSTADLTLKSLTHGWVDTRGRI